MENKNNINESSNKEKKDKEDNNSKILILYDELQFSSEVVKEKINNIFKAIESHNEDKNNKKKLFHKEKNAIISLNNKYYTCDITYEIDSINKIDDKDLSLYEGIILFFEETSIKNKIFSDKSHHFKDDHNYSSCIIIFEEDRDDLQNAELFDEFIGQTIDKHFEVICNCENLKEFNEDDGIGAINLSLHSTQWKGSKPAETKKENKSNEKKEDKKEDKKDSKEGDKKEVKEDDKKFYEKLKDNDEIEKVFGRIKEIKQINSNPNISNEERRNNAEKAVMMLMEMFGLDEDENLEDVVDSDEDDKKEKEKEQEKK